MLLKTLRTTGVGCPTQPPPLSLNPLADEDEQVPAGIVSGFRCKGFTITRLRFPDVLHLLPFLFFALVNRSFQQFLRCWREDLPRVAHEKSCCTNMSAETP